MAKDDDLYERMVADPELHDENDSEYKLEQFEILKKRAK